MCYYHDMIKRQIEAQIIQLMKDYPSVTIYGPRQCGKTTTVRELFPDFSYANLEDIGIRRLASDDPVGFFSRFPEPVIIDEIQRVPELVSMVQVRIDRNKKKGQYILTGSQQIPLREAVSQSLAGRTAVLNMLPLSVMELGMEGIRLDRDTQLLAGCMPYLYANDGISTSEYYKSYIETYLERDIAMQNQVHDMVFFERMLRLLASRVGQLVNESSLAADVGINVRTLKGWLSILESTHMIYRLKPWNSSRTSQEVKTPKLYFCDTGIVSCLLGIENPAQMNRDPLMGQIFENLIVMEALKAEYDNNVIDSLFFFRNSNGVEVDIIHSRPEGKNIFEVKSAMTLNREFLKNIGAYSRKHGANASSVIYAGEDCPEYLGSSFINFHNAYSFFCPKEEKFRLHLQNSPD